MGRGFLSLTAPSGLRVVEGAFKNKGAPEHEMNYILPYGLISREPRAKGS